MHGTEQSDVVWKVATAVAEAEGVDPVAVDPPLGRVVDADALNVLCTSMQAGEVAFEYGGYEVTVGSDGRVSVRERAVPEA